MPNRTAGVFYFVCTPKFSSFALIEVRGPLPEVIPDEVLRLMPGNHDGKHQGVILKRDDAYLLEQVGEVFPSWLSPSTKEWKCVSGLTYRLRGKYSFV